MQPPNHPTGEPSRKGSFCADDNIESGLFIVPDVALELFSTGKEMS
jgi:hypothetical protein